MPTCNYPILPRDEAASANGHVGEFECLDNGLGDVRPDVDVTCLCQLVASSHGSRLCLPLYKVVRIHGSVGWKSSAVSIAGDCSGDGGSYRCLEIVSMELEVYNSRQLTLDPLRPRKELPLHFNHD
jgi:hypothetical protein